MAALGHRRAIAGGRPREAEALFERYVAQRALRLPPTFREALDQLDGRLDSAPIPQARLDWACAARRQADRAQWERARWGHLVDHLLFDWLECREDSVEEAMQLLGELDTGERSSRRCWRAEAWWSPPPTSVPCTPA